MDYYRVTKLDIPRFWKNIISMSVVPVIFLIVGYIIVNKLLPVRGILEFLIEIVIYSILYSVFTWIFTMNTYERNLFLDLIKRLIPFLR